MAVLRNLRIKLVKQENGAEAVEYAMILGLIAILVITAVNATGVKVLARWNTVSTALVAADTSSTANTGHGNNGHAKGH